jgi:N-acetylmuramoyl-L-alanine amidase
MKYFYLIVLFVLFLASLKVHAEGFQVVIDPGHGGTDVGAVSGDVKEADLTLEISKKLSQLLKNDPQFNVILTRYTDRVVSLDERTSISKRAHADLFISIHANSSTDLAAKGAEIYFQSQMPADEEALFLASKENIGAEKRDPAEEVSDEPQGDLAVIVDDLKKNESVYNSELFSETLVQNWKKKLSLRHEPIRQGPFHVLVNAPMPSVLVEVGFVTNSKELTDLKNNSHQNQIAEIIYKSIKNYKEKIDKGEFSSHIVSHATRL